MRKHLSALALAAAFLLTPPTFKADAWAFIKGHNICGVNVAQWRRSLGLRVPAGFARAMSWLALPKAGEHPGAVLVIMRGHGRAHVAGMLGRGMCKNPSSRRQAWHVVPCNSIWRGHARYIRG